VGWVESARPTKAPHHSYPLLPRRPSLGQLLQCIASSRKRSRSITPPRQIPASRRNRRRRQQRRQRIGHTPTSKPPHGNLRSDTQSHHPPRVVELIVRHRPHNL